MIKAFKAGKHVWWQRPHIRKDADLEVERKASWLELFWDLIFVAVIAQLSQYIMQSTDHLKATLEFILLFIPVWWLWNGITFYNERYEMNNVRHRFLMFISMLPIAGMAYTIPNAMDGLANSYAYYNVAARLLLAYMWMTACRTDLEKSLSVHFSTGLLVSSALFIASVFVKPNCRILLWIFAAIADLASPLFSLHIQARLPKISTSHLPERFGLLIILTLGETVISSIKGLTQLKHISWLMGVIAVQSLLITFFIWWLYIDHVLYRVFKPKLLYALSWCYLHLPLSIVIIVLSALISIINTRFYTGVFRHVPAELLWLLVLFVCSALFIMILFNVVSDSNDHQNKLINFHTIVERDLVLYKLGGIIFILVTTTVFHAVLSPVLLLLIICMGLFIPVAHGLYIWIKSHLLTTQQS